MRDDFLTRDWAGEHRRMAVSIDKLVHSILHGFERLHAIRFDAPWRRIGTREA